MFGHEFLKHLPSLIFQQRLHLFPFALVVATLISLFLCSKISYRFNLVDLPNERKIHTEATAYTGGIAISVILLLAIILFDNFSETVSLILSIAF